METAGRLTEEYIAGALLIDGDAVAQRIRGLVNRDDFEVQACGAVFGAAMALYDDHAPIDPASISNWLKRSGEELPVDYLAQAVENLTAVIIDYLGLIQPTTRGGSLYETVTQTSRELKRMAVNLGVPVICLAQLSRSVEGRDDKRPRLSDLRDSGAIERDADAVMFLYRDDYYHPREDAAPGFPSLVELDVAKNRHARTGRDEFSFWPGTGRFVEVQ